MTYTKDIVVQIVSVILTEVRWFLKYGGLCRDVGYEYPAELTPAEQDECRYEVMQELRKLLPTNIVLEGKYPQGWYGSDHEKVTIRERELPRHVEHGVWMHTVNPEILDLLPAIEQVINLDMEICCCECEDEQFVQTDYYLGVSFIGPAEAVWDHDVWSSVDVMGRRMKGDREGAPRTEAWVIPSQCQVNCVVTDNEDWAAQLTEAGYFVVIASKKTLSPPVDHDDWKFGDEWDY